MINTIIKNGHVIDPRAGIDGVCSIGISGGHMMGIVPDSTEADTVIDAAGNYVFPGLVDFHTHIFRSGSDLGVVPDCLLAMGVTTAVDAGTAGCAGFEAFYANEVSHSAVDIFTQLNVCSIGQPGDNFMEDFTPSRFCEDKIRRLCREFPGQIKGLKIRIGAEVPGVDSLEPMRRAKELAVSCGLPLVVHASNPPAPMDELVTILDRGDVCSHFYHGKGEHTILDENGRVRPGIRAARERGVVFDCANGNTNYNHQVARRALADGFLPDIISSDLCKSSMRDGYARCLPYVMSKYLHLGMSLPDIVRAATDTPARQLGLGGKIGTLAEGARADVAVCRLVEAHPVYLDNLGTPMAGTQMLVPVMTLKDGETMFRQSNF
ncbi:MAG: amidohydrolase family protein [Candidatus Heteroscillospira sp.]|jgi:dihydroorotase